MHRLLCFPVNQGQRGNLRRVPQTGELFQGLLGGRRESLQLAHHQLHHVIGVALGVNALEIPGPARGIMIEGEHAFFGERGQELDGEEWIAAGLLVHQLRQRRGAFGLAAQRVRDQLPEMLAGERRQRDLRDLAAGGLDGVELAHQRMGGGDFIVAIGADQHQVAQIRLGQQVLQQIERRRVEPLQIVEEERQRMFGPGEDADEPPQHQLESPLRLLRLKLGHRRLVADDEPQFRNEIDHQLAVRAQRLQKGIAPDAERGVALAEQRPDEALKGLRQGRIGDVALVLVELAGREEPARRHQRLVQLIDDRGFADAGIARDQHQLRRPAFDDAIEGGKQGLDLARSAIKLLGYDQPVGPVMFAEGKRFNPVLRLPRRQAAPQVALQAGGGLVAVLGRLGEQLHDDRRDGAGNFRHPLGGRDRLPRDVAMHPLHRLGRP